MVGMYFHKKKRKPIHGQNINDLKFARNLMTHTTTFDIEF